jgi:hypothetical protein
VFEFLETAETAKVVGRALVIERSLARGGIDLHPAHRIDDFATHEKLYFTRNGGLGIHACPTNQIKRYRLKRKFCV